MDYLDRLRGHGVSERYVGMERDAWIMIAAQVPDVIDAVIAAKHQQLEDPDARKLYSLVSEAVDNQGDDALLVEIADILERLCLRAAEAGALGDEPFDDQLVELLDAVMLESAPEAARLLTIMEERGWKGWTRIERVPPRVPTPSPEPPADPQTGRFGRTEQVRIPGSNREEHQPWFAGHRSWARVRVRVVCLFRHG